jgi:hypothetical protein
MAKSREYNGVKVQSGSELFKHLEDGQIEKASQLAKKLDAEMYARGEKPPAHLRNFAIGAPHKEGQQ